MRSQTAVLLLLAAGRIYPQATTPNAAEQKKILARMREAAVTYADRLQDFICIQTTIRTTKEDGAKNWKPLETQELELNYVSHKEHYKLLTVNGSSNDLEKHIKQGYFRPGGEFGTALQRIFAPKAQAEFEWDHAEQSDGRNLCVFRYRVDRSTTTLIMKADFDVIALAHHGLVHADCDSGAVMRIQMETESGSVVRGGRTVLLGAELDVRYGPTMIGSKEFLLPQSAMEIGRFHTRLTKAEIQFRDYRKYDAKSTITFDDKNQ